MFPEVVNNSPLSELIALRQALDTHAIVAITDRRGVITHVNDLFCKISQYSREELLGQTHRIVKSDYHPREFFVEMWRTILRGEVWHGEVCNRAKDGSRYWLHTTIYPVKDDSGQIVQFVSIRTDITARKTAETALALREGQLRTLLQNIPGTAFRCRYSATNCLVEFVSENVRELTGYTEAELRSCGLRLLTDLVHAEDAARVAAERRAIAVRGGAYEMEYRIVHASGETRHVWERAQVVATAGTDGETLCDGVLFDVTERKQVEERLQAARRLREDRARLATFVQSAPVALAMFDRELRHLAASDRWIRDHGLQGQSVLGRTLQEVLPTFPVENARLDACNCGSDCTREGELISDSAADGNQRTLRWRMQPWCMGEKLGGFVVFTEDITAIRRAEQALRESKDRFQRAARTDQLTGLPNRLSFFEHLQAAIHESGRCWASLYAVMFLDFDRFKVVNDSLGHEAGDVLLRYIADRLRTELRLVEAGEDRSPEALAARLGGDEFVVLLEQIDGPDQALAVARQLLKAFDQPYRIGGVEVHPTASIGVVFGDDRYQRAEEVIRDADTAMYEAKRAGRNRYAVFDGSMRERILRRLTLENDLRRAIDQNQLWLAYQPIVSLTSGELKAVEVLVRWNHQNLGAVSPGEFVPLAEESDLILRLGEWVLRQACRQAMDWSLRLGAAAPPLISVNLSRKQFLLPDLPAMIRRIVDEAGIAPHRIQLEVTEDFFAGDLRAAIAAMRMLKAHGLKLAIDDFGTGTSSFASLHEFPVDVLKIDRSMLEGIDRSKDTAALVHSLAVLVRNLGITLVAEGIERSSQVIALQELGCNYGQGYFFARPMPHHDLEEYLLRGQAGVVNIEGATAYANRWEKQLKVFTPLELEIAPNTAPANLLG